MYTRPGLSSQTDPQTGIRIAIEPSQSAYFAGEPFTCTITFSNVRAGELPKPRPAGGNTRALSSSSSSPSPYDLQSTLTPVTATATTTTTTTVQKHTRSSHSVSSVPLARPPTSPGTPKTAGAPPYYGGLGVAAAAIMADEDTGPRRKGLVGKMGENAEKEKDKKRLGRSMSLSVDVMSEVMSPRSPVSPSPSPKRDTTLPASHPHARKQSVTTAAGLLSPDTIPNIHQPSPTSPLSTIHENTNSPTYAYPYSAPSTPSGTRFTKTNPLLQQPSLAPHPSSSNKTSPRHFSQPHSAYATTFSPLSTELLLYAYAQLSGGFHIDPIAVHNAPEMYALKDKLRKGRVGGGSLDFVVGSSTARSGLGGGRGHRRGASWFGGLFGGGGGGGDGGATDGGAAGGSGTTSSPGGGGGGDDDLPTFETQPSLLAIDLRLAPGESKSYTYSIDLPSSLPPTFKGRAMRFSYQLIVGTCRASSGLVPGSGSAGGRGNVQTSRVMRIPIRMYNYISVDSPSRPYDLLWPISKRREKAVVGVTQEIEKSQKGIHRGTAAERSGTGVSNRPPSQSSSSPPDPSLNQSLHSLKAYAHKLLVNNNISLGDDNDRESLNDLSNGSERVDNGLGIIGGGGGLTGCREAVEIVTRNTRKVSYDITKDNTKVAELTFVKSAYRLGESVHVVVEFNNDACTSKVLKISSTLESHEHPPWLASPSELIRRIHGEYYSSGTINSRRVAFSHDIPSDGSPCFDVVEEGDRGEPSTRGGHQWKVRLRLLIAVSGSERANANTSSSTSLSSTTGGSSFKGKNKRIEIRNISRDDSSDNEGDTGATDANGWGKVWKTVAPMERVGPTTNGSSRNSTNPTASSTSPGAVPKGLGFTSSASKGLSAWVGFFNPIAAGTYHDADEVASDEDDEGMEGSGRKVGKQGSNTEDDEDDGEEEWIQMNAETVECLIPVLVYPSNTAYKPVEVVFEV